MLVAPETNVICLRMLCACGRGIPVRWVSTQLREELNKIFSRDQPRQIPDDEDQDGPRNVAFFCSSDAADGPRRVYWILSPRKLQIVCGGSRDDVVIKRARCPRIFDVTSAVRKCNFIGNDYYSATNQLKFRKYFNIMSI
jgi:hypothetical protein